MGNKNIDEIAGYRTVNVFIKGAEHIPPAPNQVGRCYRRRGINRVRT